MSELPESQNRMGQSNSTELPETPCSSSRYVTNSDLMVLERRLELLVTEVSSAINSRLLGQRFFCYSHGAATVIATPADMGSSVLVQSSSATEDTPIETRPQLKTRHLRGTFRGRMVSMVFFSSEKSATNWRKIRYFLAFYLPETTRAETFRRHF